MFDVDFFVKEFDDVRTPAEWDVVCKKRKCENYLEDYLSKVVYSFNQNDIYLVTNPKETLLINSGLGVASNSEYYSILPIVGKSNMYMFYFFTYNIDNRVVYVSIDDRSEDKKSGIAFKIDIAEEKEYKFAFQHKGHSIITMKFYDGDNCYKTEKFEMNVDTIHKYYNTGKFEWKKKERPRIKLVHIQTTLNDERERASRDSLIDVRNHGWHYILHLNEPYKSLPPSYNCIRPNCVSMELFDEPTVQKLGTALTPAHYGCYQAFRDAILSEFYDCDFLIVCEGDCIIEVDTKEFIEKVESCAHLLEPNGIEFMSFGDKDTLEHGWPQSPVIKEVNDDMYVTNHIIGLQCIMFPANIADRLKDTLRRHKWDAADMYFNNIFAGNRMGIVKKRLTTQADGFSLIDNMQKTFRK
jgi:hypothetical protein